MFTLFFTDQEVVDFETAMTSDTKRFAQYFQFMLQEGIYMAPSQFEAMFVSAAVTSEVTDRILEASKKAVSNIAVMV
jgi:glutamate-1-semialdehyde 2,1-aminomutase